MDAMDMVPVWVVLIAGVVIGVIDVSRYKIYNVCTIPLLASALLYHIVQGGWLGLGTSLAGMAFGFGVLLVPYLFGGMGAGDVKLMAAVGAWLGLPTTLYVLVATGLAAGIYGMALLVVTGGVREAMATFVFGLYRPVSLVTPLSPDDQIKAVLASPDRRRRLIPWAAMLPVGIVAFLIVSRL